MNLGTKLALGVACWGAAKALLNELTPAPDLDESGSIVSCTASPIWEEIFFRDGLNDVVGPGLGSLLFGFAHVYNRPPDSEALVRFVDTAVCGAALSAVYAQCGLPVAIATHAAHNVGVWAVRAHFDRKRRAGIEASRRALRGAVQAQRARLVAR